MFWRHERWLRNLNNTHWLNGVSLTYSKVENQIKRKPKRGKKIAFFFSVFSWVGQQTRRFVFRAIAPKLENEYYFGNIFESFLGFCAKSERKGNIKTRIVSGRTRQQLFCFQTLYINPADRAVYVCEKLCTPINKGITIFICFFFLFSLFTVTIKRKLPCQIETRSSNVTYPQLSKNAKSNYFVLKFSFLKAAKSLVGKVLRMNRET